MSGLPSPHTDIRLSRIKENVSVTKTLDWRAEQAVSYCIPIWLRDEQIRSNIARVKARITPHEGRREDTVAVACFGPSLKQTWEALRGYKYLISCSGSHKFLIERGIIPTWHVEVDPRDHKIALLGEPHRDALCLDAVIPEIRI